MLWIAIKPQSSVISDKLEDKNIEGTQSENQFFSGNSRILLIHKILGSYKKIKGKIDF